MASYFSSTRQIAGQTVFFYDFSSVCVAMLSRSSEYFEKRNKGPWVAEFFRNVWDLITDITRYSSPNITIVLALCTKALVHILYVTHNI